MALVGGDVYKHFVVVEMSDMTIGNVPKFHHPIPLVKLSVCPNLNY